MGLATLLNRRKYDEEDREAGKAAIMMGADWNFGRSNTVCSERSAASLAFDMRWGELRVLSLR